MPFLINPFVKSRPQPKALPYRWFSPDVIATMLVHRTKERKVFWEFVCIIMQNTSQICHCFVHQHGRLIT